MNDDELNAAVARLMGYTIEFSSDNRKVKITRPDGTEVMPPYSVTGWCDADALDTMGYTTDVGAAMRACLTLGYLPHIEKTRTLNHDTGQFEYVLAVGLDDGNFVSYIDSVQQTHEITQAIAAALVDALLAAEEV